MVVSPPSGREIFSRYLGLVLLSLREEVPFGTPRRNRSHPDTPLEDEDDDEYEHETREPVVILGNDSHGAQRQVFPKNSLALY
jgi:hypothetical protein